MDERLRRIAVRIASKVGSAQCFVYETHRSSAEVCAFVGRNGRYDVVSDSLPVDDARAVLAEVERIQALQIPDETKCVGRHE